MFSDSKEEAGTVLLALTLPPCHLETVTGWDQGDLHPSAGGPSLTLANTQKAEASQSSLLAAAHFCSSRHIRTFPVQHKQVSQHYNALNHSLLVGIHRELENKVLAFQTPPPTTSEPQKPCHVFPHSAGRDKIRKGLCVCKILNQKLKS